jgi:hypothetical protein
MDVSADFATYTAAGVLVTDGADLPNQRLAPNVWTRLMWPVTVAATATRGMLRIYAKSSLVVGATYDVTGWQLTEGTGQWDYLDGARVAPAGYVVAWTGTAHASTSTITRTAGAISEEALFMAPGAALWDFLAPLVEASNLRFWCDEARLWWLTEDAYQVAGSVYVSAGLNLTEGSEVISLEGDQFYSSVVVRYIWSDASGVALVKYDAVGGGDALLFTERRTPYPGPGAAAAIQSRGLGRARTLGVTAIADPRATPTQAMTAALPATPTQVGILSAVSWNYPADTMELQSRDMGETPANAIDLLPGTIDSLTGTIDSH